MTQRPNIATSQRHDDLSRVSVLASLHEAGSSLAWREIVYELVGQLVHRLLIYVVVVVVGYYFSKDRRGWYNRQHLRKLVNVIPTVGRLTDGSRMCMTHRVNRSHQPSA